MTREEMQARLQEIQKQMQKDYDACHNVKPRVRFGGDSSKNMSAVTHEDVSLFYALVQGYDSYKELYDNPELSQEDRAFLEKRAMQTGIATKDPVETYNTCLKAYQFEMGDSDVLSLREALALYARSAYFKKSEVMFQSAKIYLNERNSDFKEQLNADILETLPSLKSADDVALSGFNAHNAKHSALDKEGVWESDKVGLRKVSDRASINVYNSVAKFLDSEPLALSFKEQLKKRYPEQTDMIDLTLVQKSVREIAEGAIHLEPLKLDTVYVPVYEAGKMPGPGGIIMPVKTDKKGIKPNNPAVQDALDKYNESRVMRQRASLSVLAYASSEKALLKEGQPVLNCERFYSVNLPEQMQKRVDQAVASEGMNQARKYNKDEHAERKSVNAMTAQYLGEARAYTDLTKVFLSSDEFRKALQERKAFLSAQSDLLLDDKVPVAKKQEILLNLAADINACGSFVDLEQLHSVLNEENATATLAKQTGEDIKKVRALKIEKAILDEREIFASNKWLIRDFNEDKITHTALANAVEKANNAQVQFLTALRVQADYLDAKAQEQEIEKQKEGAKTSENSVDKKTQTTPLTAHLNATTAQNITQEKKESDIQQTLDKSGQIGYNV